MKRHCLPLSLETRLAVTCLMDLMEENELQVQYDGARQARVGGTVKA